MKNDTFPPDRLVFLFYFSLDIDSRLFVSLWLFRAFDASSSRVVV